MPTLALLVLASRSTIKQVLFYYISTYLCDEKARAAARKHGPAVPVPVPIPIPVKSCAIERERESKASRTLTKRTRAQAIIGKSGESTPGKYKLR